MPPANIFADPTNDGPEIGTLVVIVDRAKNLPNRKSTKQNPYCQARLGKYAGKTKTDRRGGQTPRWDEELRFTVHESADYQSLKLSVFNDDRKTDLIGDGWINLKDVILHGGGQNDLWQELKCQQKYAGEVRVELTFYDSRPRVEKPPASATPDRRTSSAHWDSENTSRLSGSVRRRPLPSNPGSAMTASTDHTQQHRKAAAAGPRQLGSTSSRHRPNPEAYQPRHDIEPGPLVHHSHSAPRIPSQYSLGSPQDNDHYHPQHDPHANHDMQLVPASHTSNWHDRRGSHHPPHYDPHQHQSLNEQQYDYDPHASLPPHDPIPGHLQHSYTSPAVLVADHSNAIMPLRPRKSLLELQPDFVVQSPTNLWPEQDPFGPDHPETIRRAQQQQEQFDSPQQEQQFYDEQHPERQFYNEQHQEQQFYDEQQQHEQQLFEQQQQREQDQHFDSQHHDQELENHQQPLALTYYQNSTTHEQIAQQPYVYKSVNEYPKQERGNELFLDVAPLPPLPPSHRHVPIHHNSSPAVYGHPQNHLEPIRDQPQQQYQGIYNAGRIGHQASKSEISVATYSHHVTAAGYDSHRGAEQSSHYQDADAVYYDNQPGQLVPFNPNNHQQQQLTVRPQRRNPSRGDQRRHSSYEYGGQQPTARSGYNTRDLASNRPHSRGLGNSQPCVGGLSYSTSSHSQTLARPAAPRSSIAASSAVSTPSHQPASQSRVIESPYDEMPIVRPLAVGPSKSRSSNHLSLKSSQWSFKGRNTIPRKSVSPRVSFGEGAKGFSKPFGPDSYDTLNPKAAIVAESAVEEPIIDFHGRVVDPSDRLPESSWAPEPKALLKSKKVLVHSQPHSPSHYEQQHGPPAYVHRSPQTLPGHAQSPSWAGAHEAVDYEHDGSGNVQHRASGSLSGKPSTFTRLRHRMNGSRDIDVKENFGVHSVDTPGSSPHGMNKHSNGGYGSSPLHGLPANQPPYARGPAKKLTKRASMGVQASSPSSWEQPIRDVSAPPGGFSPSPVQAHRHHVSQSRSQSEFHHQSGHQQQTMRQSYGGGITRQQTLPPAIPSKISLDHMAGGNSVLNSPNTGVFFTSGDKGSRGGVNDRYDLNGGMQNMSLVPYSTASMSKRSGGRRLLGFGS